MKELVDELVKKSEKAKKDLETKVEGIVEKVLGKMNLASKEDIARLEEKIRYIEQQKSSENKPGTSK